MLIGLDASRAVTRQRTGTEAYAYYLIHALIPLVAARGHRLRLYFNQPPPSELLPESPHIEPVIIPFPRLWTHLRLAWELHRRPPDVFFTPAHVIPLTYRRPSVATVHDLGYHHFPEAHPRRQLVYLRWSTRHNGRIARRVLADSLATKEDLLHFYHLPANKIDVVYPGVDPTLAPEQDETRIAAMVQKYGISPPYLLYLGTLQPRKNLVRLVEAYAASGVHYQLVLAGKVGWLAQPLLDTIKRMDLSPRNGRSAIVTAGFVDDADKAALLSGATALLFPSLYEGFGFPVLEAQACGTAVLCADSSSLREVAGNSAFLVDPLDVTTIALGIRQVVQDPLLRHELVQKGFANVARFTWPETAVRVLHNLEQAAA